MGSDPVAHLGYGYDLGGPEGWHVAGLDEYGGLQLDWLGEDDDFTEAAETRLLVASGFTETDWQADGYFDRKRAAEKALGVEFSRSGTWEYCGEILVASGSTSSVEWSETMPLDLDALRYEPHLPLWNEKLTAALSALGLTPTQDGPKWLVYPFYG
jgi:hypothetical protein